MSNGKLEVSLIGTLVGVDTVLRLEKDARSRINDIDKQQMTVSLAR